MRNEPASNEEVKRSSYIGSDQGKQKWRETVRNEEVKGSGELQSIPLHAVDST